MEKEGFFQHPKALVDEGAQIGNGTRIWAFAHIHKGAKIGENCNICDYATVESGASLGNQCTVKNSVQIWEGVEAGNGIFFGPNCVLTNDRLPRAFLKKPKGDWLEPTKILDGATIGANATIVCGVTVGRYSFIGAGAVITRDIPDFAMVLGNPGRVSGWVSRNLQKLEFKGNGSTVKCPESGKEYTLSSDGNSVRES